MLNPSFVVRQRRACPAARDSHPCSWRVRHARPALASRHNRGPKWRLASIVLLWPTDDLDQRGIEGRCGPRPRLLPTRRASPLSSCVAFLAHPRRCRYRHGGCITEIGAGKAACHCGALSSRGSRTSRRCHLTLALDACLGACLVVCWHPVCHAA